MRAVVRTQSVKYSSLSEALRHRLGYPEDEGLVERIEKVLRDAYHGKITKRSSLKEFVIGLDREVSKEKALEIAEEYLLKLEDKLGFKPYSQVFIHRKRGRTHIHILSVLRYYDGKKWRSAKLTPGMYQAVVREFLSRVAPESLQKIAEKGRGIGAYPLWAIRVCEMLIGSEEARELVKYARSVGVQKGEFIEWLRGYREDPEAVRTQLKKTLEGFREKVGGRKKQVIELDLNIGGAGYGEGLSL